MQQLYAGNILIINLSDGTIRKQPTAPYAADLLGGRGINMRLLYDRVGPEIKPLDPQNAVIFGSGPLCCTPVPAGRVEITSKSPETGYLGQSNMGGSFGPEMKYAGYDHLLITGKAEQPVYLWIDNDQVEIRKAGYLWGKDTYATQDVIRENHDPETKVVCIGKAGENRVCFATVRHGLKHAGGRTGMGAVFGSKNLKAIAVRGTHSIALADPARYLTAAEEIQNSLKSHPGVEEWRRHGLSRYQDMFYKMMYPEAFKSAPFRQFDLFSKYNPAKTGCAGCPVQCNDVYPVTAKGGGAISCSFYTSPFYTVGNTDLDLGLECGLLAQRAGVDIISSMRIISWVMTLYENGIITAGDTDGIPMERGSKQAILGMLHKMIDREGFGDLLADGMRAAAEQLGSEALAYANQVKGLPIYETFEPETLIPQKATALGLVVSSRGDTMKTRTDTFIEELDLMRMMSDHRTADVLKAAKLKKIKRIAGSENAADPKTYAGKAELVIYAEDIITCADCLGACKFMGSFLSFPFDEDWYAELLSIGSGKETGTASLFRTARRIKHLERAFCAREGMSRETDTLPKRFLDTTLKEGVFKGWQITTKHFEAMKDRYYRLRGWDVQTGIPTAETLKRYNLGDVAVDLQQKGIIIERLSE